MTRFDENGKILILLKLRTCKNKNCSNKIHDKAVNVFVKLFTLQLTRARTIFF